MRISMSPGQAYCNQMDALTSRIRLAKLDVKAGRETKLPEKAIWCETACLQLRMALEHLAFSSLIVNEKVFAAVVPTYKEYVNSKKMLEKLKKLNANFYPKQVVSIEVTENSDHFHHHINVRRSAAFNEDEFIAAWSRCGTLLHAQNPFSQGIDYFETLELVDKWCENLQKLIKHHLVELYGGAGFYLVEAPLDKKTKAKRLEPQGGDPYAWIELGEIARE